MNGFITAIEVLGLAAIVYGVWLVSEPAAFITGGVAALVIAWRLS